MAYVKRTPPTTPKSPRGVNFFQQFTRQFLRPYGEAKDAPTPETVFRRLQPFTCEWLIPPKVAASEFAETLIKNLELLHADQSELVSHDSISYLQQSLADLTNNLAPLRKESENNPTRNNIVQVMKFLFNDNDELDTAMDNVFRLGRAMLATACHYIVASTLVRDPQGYADDVQCENGIDASFKRNKNIPSMRDFMVDNILGG